MSGHVRPVDSIVCYVVLRRRVKTVSQRIIQPIDIPDFVVLSQAHQFLRRKIHEIIKDHNLSLELLECSELVEPREMSDVLSMDAVSSARY